MPCVKVSRSSVRIRNAACPVHGSAVYFDHARDHLYCPRCRADVAVRRPIPFRLVDLPGRPADVA